MDEEELQKRFTDCVYFLASPLTCKKGIECVYRHSEIARLNPRDCWYWIGGCCYNPDCAFRHPPLEGIKETYHESSNPNNIPTLPVVEKTNIPCYFYSKGFCNKADRCQFLHEPVDCNKPMVKNEVLSVKQLSAGNNTELTPVRIAHNNTAETEPTQTVMKHTPDSQQLDLRSESVESEENAEEQEELVESEENAVENEENVVENEENVVESEEIVVQSESDDYNDQSSDYYLEQEKWLELSPGYNLLESERLEYDDDDEVNQVDFFSVNDEEHMDLGFNYSEYEQIDDISVQPRVSIFNRLSFKKRNNHKKLFSNIQRGSDLRDRLKKSKSIDFDRHTHKTFQPYASRGEVDFDHRGWLRKSVPVNRYRSTVKKPRFVSSDVMRFRMPAQQWMGESREDSAVFTGPKTLDQIKEEKRKARENRGFGSNNRNGSDGLFQGPRPLSEILKNKRKLV